MRMRRNGNQIIHSVASNLGDCVHHKRECTAKRMAKWWNDEMMVAGRSCYACIAHEKPWLRSSMIEQKCVMLRGGFCVPSAGKNGWRMLRAELSASTRPYMVAHTVPVHVRLGDDKCYPWSVLVCFLCSAVCDYRLVLGKTFLIRTVHRTRAYIHYRENLDAINNNCNGWRLSDAEFATLQHWRAMLLCEILLHHRKDCTDSAERCK